MKRKLNFLQRMAARGQVHFKTDPLDESGAGGSSTTGATEGEQEDEGTTDDKSVTEGEKDDEGITEKTGMSEADAKLLREVMKWKERARGAEDEMGRLKSVIGDSDPEKIQKLLQMERDREIQELEAKGEYERILAQVKEEHTKSVETLRTEREELAETLNKTVAQIEELTIGREFSDSSYIRERSVLPPKIARKEFGTHFEFVDGELVGYDKPRGAKDRTPLVDGEGKPKAFDAAIEQLYSKHPDALSLIRSTQKPGAGSTTTQVSGKTVKDSTAEPLRGRDRITAALLKS